MAAAAASRRAKGLKMVMRLVFQLLWLFSFYSSPRKAFHIFPADVGKAGTVHVNGAEVGVPRSNTRLELSRKIPYNDEVEVMGVRLRSQFDGEKGSRSGDSIRGRGQLPEVGEELLSIRRSRSRSRARFRSRSRCRSRSGSRSMASGLSPDGLRRVDSGEDNSRHVVSLADVNEPHAPRQAIDNNVRCFGRSRFRSRFRSRARSRSRSASRSGSRSMASGLSPDGSRRVDSGEGNFRHVVSSADVNEPHAPRQAIDDNVRRFGCESGRTLQCGVDSIPAKTSARKEERKRRIGRSSSFRHVASKASAGARERRPSYGGQKLRWDEHVASKASHAHRRVDFDHSRLADVRAMPKQIGAQRMTTRTDMAENNNDSTSVFIRKGSIDEDDGGGRLERDQFERSDGDRPKKKKTTRTKERKRKRSWMTTTNGAAMADTSDEDGDVDDGMVAAFIQRRKQAMAEMQKTVMNAKEEVLQLPAQQPLDLASHPATLIQNQIEASSTFLLGTAAGASALQRLLALTIPFDQQQSLARLESSASFHSAIADIPFSQLANRARTASVGDSRRVGVAMAFEKVAMTSEESLYKRPLTSSRFPSFSVPSSSASLPSSSSSSSSSSSCSSPPPSPPSPPFPSSLSSSSSSSSSSSFVSLSSSSSSTSASFISSSSSSFSVSDGDPSSAGDGAYTSPSFVDGYIHPIRRNMQGSSASPAIDLEGLVDIAITSMASSFPSVFIGSDYISAQADVTDQLHSAMASRRRRSLQNQHVNDIAMASSSPELSVPVDGSLSPSSSLSDESLRKTNTAMVSRRTQEKPVALFSSSLSAAPIICRSTDQTFKDRFISWENRQMRRQKSMKLTSMKLTSMKLTSMKLTSPPPPPPPPPSSSSSSSSSAAAVAAAAASGPSSSASAAAAAAAWNGEAVAGVVAYNGAKLAGASARSSMLAASRGDNGDPREIQLPNPSMSCHSVSTKSMIETAATSSKQSKQGPAVWSEADEYYADVGGRRVLNESQLRRPFAETSVRMGGRFPSEHATSEETEKGEGEGETRAAEEEDEIPHVSSSSATWQSRRTLTRSRSSGDEEEECDESLSSSVRSGRAKSFSVLGRSAAAERLRISKVRECTTTGIEEEEEEEEEQTTSSSAEVSTDTIAAIVTAVAGQQGAVAIVRLSGRDAIAITSRVFQPARKRRKAGGNATWRPESHRVEYGTVVDGDGRPVDEVIVVPMLAPRSYTREDVVELQCHGGEVCVSRVLQACLECGARLAKPGEFTLRAFLNGRLDLTQAESVADLVTARTSQAADSALAGLKGGMSSIIRSLRAECIDLLVEMEARLDFDDELPPFDPTVLAQRLTAMWKEVQRALCTAKRGRLLQSGMEVVIVGRPNVGKSSLLNTWSGTDRAIVTEIPGTTRDIVESSVVVGGFPVRLLDTAGIRETQDKVESIGVQRSTSAAVDADVIIMVVSAADGWTDADDTIVERIWGCCTGSHDHATAPSSSPPSSSSPLHGGVWEAGSLSGPMSIAAVPAEVGSQEEAQQVSQFARRRRRPLAPAILAVNKVDRAPFHAVRVPPHAADVFRTMVATSATVGSGIDDLERAILDLVGVGDVASDGLGWTVNQRQAEQLVRAGEALERVKASIEQNLPVDFWTIDLRDAALALGQISGDDVAEEVLSGVFSRFCIGK